MTITQLDLRQSISHDTLDQIVGTAGTQANILMQDINSELTMPLRMMANSPANLVVNIGAISVTNPGHSRTQTISPLKLGIPTFTSGTVTVAINATSGLVTATPSAGSAITFTMTSSQHVKLAVSIDASGNLSLTNGTAASSLATAGTPPLVTNTFAIGYIDVSTTAAASPSLALNNVANSALYQYVGGGSGSGSGSGEKNYIGDPDSIGASWIASGAGITLVTDSTSAELPEVSKKTGIKITGVSGTDYARYRWTIDNGDKSKKLKIFFYLRSLAAYVSGDFKIEMYSNTASDYSGSFTSLPIGSLNIPKNDSGQTYITSFDSTTADYYELRITRVSGTSSVILSGVLVGPGVLMQTAAISEWQTFTPTATNLTSSGSNASVVGYYRRLGDSMEGVIRWRNGSTGGGTAGTVTFTVPSSLTIDSAKISLINGNGSQAVGVGNWYDSEAAAEATMSVVALTSTTLALLADNVASYLDGLNDVGSNQDDIFTFRFMIPISQWSGQGTVNISQNNAEYLTNSNTSTSASDTTSFGYGQAGTSIVNISSANAIISKRVRAQFSISASDFLMLKVSQDGTKWFPAESIFPFLVTTTAQYGMRLVRVSSSATDVDVQFGGDGANGQEAWSVYNTWMWRVDHSVAGQVVGFTIADASNSGLISATQQTIGGQKILNQGVTTPDTTSGSVTVDSGKTLFHPNLTIANTDVYTVNGTLLSANAIIVTSGTLIANGPVQVSNWS